MPAPFPSVLTPKQEPAVAFSFVKQSPSSLPGGGGRTDQIRSCFLLPFSEGERNLAASCSWTGCRWQNKKGQDPTVQTASAPLPGTNTPQPPLASAMGRHARRFSSLTAPWPLQASPPLRPVSKLAEPQRRSPPAPTRPDQREAVLTPGFRCTRWSPPGSAGWG